MVQAAVPSRVSSLASNGLTCSPSLPRAFSMCTSKRAPWAMV
jgi:hypothetical protein